MPTPYYVDESVTLYCGDSLDVLPQLDIQADVLLTDPPYFKVKQDEWDNQWDKASEFLAWMGDFLDAAKPLLTPQASIWVFASPAMTSSVERLVGERFRVLNSIRWVKEAGWHQKAEVASLRSYLTPWEGIVFAEQDVTFSPIGDYIKSERERSGWDANSLEVALGYVRTKNPERGTELVRRWEEGSSIPGSGVYAMMREVLGESYLTRPYADLVAEYNATRRPFNIRERKHSTDVWTFDPVSPFPGKHPCEKPQSMLRHMVTASSRPGELILDPFAGSGSTLLAAAGEGRRAIGIEKDERWCEHAANRLSQGTLDLFGDAA
jgi:site-specific DNA-methyltransferase (adenine-specific)